ncbi:MAG: class I SAM-dependent RNA methyltransferase [Verrucomicrobia bacterium]|nr:class I SAM-dependent RNA methyltransferase [Verrucomicrobiota bacterium]MCH8513892.1 hypothetical protein [Kiritimatiellia bacterium]
MISEPPTSPETETANILDMGDGKMLGQCPSGEKIWLTGPAVPGDEVSFLRKGKGGAVLRILREAPDRIPAPCPHFAQCPGCNLQPLPYERQCELKASKIVETLRRIGGIKEYDWRGLTPSAEAHGTRNKLDLQVQGTQFGYTNGWELIPIEDCMLGNDAIREVLAGIRALLTADHGIHRMMIRSDTRRDKIMVLVRGDPVTPALTEYCANHPRITGLAQQPEKTAAWRQLYGEPTLEMHLADISHEIHWDQFFQVHEQQAECLVRTAMAWLAEKPVQNVLDLFCGVGAFTLPAARLADQVLGVDSFPGQGPFLRGDLSKGLPDDIRLHRSRWDVVIMDPPRAGMEKKLCKQIRDKLKPERILYVSCDPATLARDLSRFCSGEVYRVERVQGFDLFPQTTHVETLALLSRN